MALLFDTLLFPLGKKTAWWGLLLASILSTLLILAVYRLLSQPAATRRLKDRIKAHILALRIYKDFPGVILRSFLSSLFLTSRYIAQNLVPLIAITPFLLLLYWQMDLRFGTRPFQKGEAFVLKASFQANLDIISADLESNRHFRLLMKPVRISELREIDWKLEAVSEGQTSIRLKTDGQALDKKLTIGREYCSLSPTLDRSRFSQLFLGHERIRAAPAAALQSLALKYPSRRLHIGRLHASWIVYYLILVFGLVLVFKNRFGIEF